MGVPNIHLIQKLVQTNVYIVLIIRKTICYPEFPPCIFIRYNPDTYRDHKGTASKTPNGTRHEILVKLVQFCIKWENVLGLKVKYLFYDGFDESDMTFENLEKEDVL